MARIRDRRGSGRIGAAVLVALGCVAALAPLPAPAAGAEAAPPPNVDSRGSNGYPDQAPVAGWIKEIAARQGKVQSLVASYEIQDQPRVRTKPFVESGTVKFRFPSDPAKQVLERWEGKSELGRILRIAVEGKIHTQVNDKVDQRPVADPERANISMVRFPALPEACAARFYVWHSSEFEPGATGPVASRPFPIALCLEPRPGSDVSPRLKRCYLAIDPDNGLAWRIRLHDHTGAYVNIELYDAKPNAAVSDADFVPPGGGKAAAPAK